MKKIAASLLLFFYLITAIGVQVHAHYCAGSVAEISYFSEANEMDCCGVTRCVKGCCYDNAIRIQLKTEHVRNTQTLVSTAVSIAEAIPMVGAYAPTVRTYSFFTPNSLSFPNVDSSIPWKEKYYLAYCSWLI